MTIVASTAVAQIRAALQAYVLPRSWSEAQAGNA